MDSTNYSSPFLCSISDAIRVRHYSRKTEKAGGAVARLMPKSYKQEFEAV